MAQWLYHWSCTGMTRVQLSARAQNIQCCLKLVVAFTVIFNWFLIRFKTLVKVSQLLKTSSGLESVNFYLRRFSESRSSSGSTPSVRPSVRLFVCPSVRLSVRLSATLLGCIVCVICNSNSFNSFIFKLCLMIGHTLKMCTSYFVHI